MPQSISSFEAVVVGFHNIVLGVFEIVISNVCFLRRPPSAPKNVVIEHRFALFCWKLLAELDFPIPILSHLPGCQSLKCHYRLIYCHSCISVFYILLSVSFLLRLWYVSSSTMALAFCSGRFLISLQVLNKSSISFDLIIITRNILCRTHCQRRGKYCVSFKTSCTENESSFLGCRLIKNHSDRFYNDDPLLDPFFSHANFFPVRRTVDDQDNLILIKLASFLA